MSVSAPPMFDGHTGASIAERCDVPHAVLLSETDSTLDVAHAMAEKGAASGTLVVADSQRAGRGRLGRAWTSPAGRGVWCSVIERPRDPRSLDVLSIRVGMNAADALDDFADGSVGLKWPNDLLIHGAKVGGILTEARWSGTSLSWVAIGVGVNVVVPENVPGSAGLRPDAHRFDVLSAIVKAIRTAARSEGLLSEYELKGYRERDTLLGRRIISPGAGSVMGIDATGALVVETAQGLERYRGGTVRIAEES